MEWIYTTICLPFEIEGSQSVWKNSNSRIFMIVLIIICSYIGAQPQFWLTKSFDTHCSLNNFNICPFVHFSSKMVSFELSEFFQFEHILVILTRIWNSAFKLTFLLVKTFKNILPLLNMKRKMQLNCFLTIYTFTTVTQFLKTTQATTFSSVIFKFLTIRLPFLRPKQIHYVVLNGKRITYFLLYWTVLQNRSLIPSSKLFF